MKDAKGRELFIGDCVIHLNASATLTSCYAYKVVDMYSYGWVETVYLFNDNIRYTFAHFHVLKCPPEIIHNPESVKLYLKMAGY